MHINFTPFNKPYTIIYSSAPNLQLLLFIIRFLNLLSYDLLLMINFLNPTGVVSPLQHITADSMNLEQPLRMIPFLLIDEINDASPAAIDGLQIGDQIVKFGSVEVGDQILTRLSSVIQLNQGKPIAVVIMRQGVLMNITMTPRQWHGRGLMG